MQEKTITRDMPKNDSSIAQPLAVELAAARALLKSDRTQGLVALNNLFRLGSVPEPALSGRYSGELIALDLAAGFTRFFQSLANAWMPWLGKTFDPARQSGDNIFRQDSYRLTRLFNPFYRNFVVDKPGTYRGFAFRTYIDSGLFDADRSVLKIDYDLRENPALTVRRVLDELVQLDVHVYLGKAHVRWWWGNWQTVAYFTLTNNRTSGA
jgi:hypothetical protein